MSMTLTFFVQWISCIYAVHIYAVD